MSEHEDCRAYMDHLRLHHRHLQQVIERLRSLVFGASGCETAADEARQLLGSLTEHFDHHVAQEAGGGCLEEAICRCPRLAEQAREVSAQYPRIKDRIARLASRFADNKQLGRMGRVAEEELAQLARELSKLESDERYILREAFGIDESFSAVRTEQLS